MPKMRLIGWLLLLGVILIVGFSFLGKESQVNIKVSDSQTRSASNLPHLIPEERNLSANFADAFSRGLIEQNKTGLVKVGDQTAAILNPPALVDEMVKSSLNIQQAEMPTISMKDLRVMPQSTEAEKTYLTAVRLIIDRVWGGFPKQDIMQLYGQGITGNDYNGLAEFSQKAGLAFDEFKNLEVPKNWVPHHIEAMKLLAQARLMTIGFLAWQEDPMRALIWLKYYPLFQNSARDLLNIYASGFEKLGI